MDTGLDPRLNFFLGGNVIFHRDDRTGIGQDGETMALAGSLSWDLTPDTTIGLATRFAKSDLSGASGTTEADTTSLATFVQGRLSQSLFYKLVGAYTTSDIDAVFVQPGITTTGSPEVNSFAAQAELSGQLTRGDVNIVPSFGANYIHVDQKAFLLSDGTVAPDQTTDRVSVSGGVSVSRTIQDARVGRTYTPSAVLTLIANLSDTTSFLLPNGTISSAGVFGANANVGLSILGDSGASYALGGTISAFEKGQVSYGLNVSVTIPFN